MASIPFNNSVNFIYPRRIEQSILIAMRSRVLCSKNTAFNYEADQNNLSTSMPDTAIDWTTLGDEPSVDLCEVQLNIDGTQASA
jgi:hypothetical protein